MIKIVAMDTPPMSYTSNMGEMERVDNLEKIREYFLDPYDNFSDDEIFYGYFIDDSIEEGEVKTIAFSLDELIEAEYIMIGEEVVDVYQFL